MNEGRKEGREEGRKGGRKGGKEGRKEGRKGRRKGGKEGEKGRKEGKEGRKNASMCFSVLILSKASFVCVQIILYQLFDQQRIFLVIILTHFLIMIYTV